MALVLGLLLSAHLLVALGVTTAILRRRKEPMAMLVWIFAVLTVPLFGVLLWLLLDSTRVRRKAGRRRRRVAHMLARVKDRAADSAAGMPELPVQTLPEDLREVERIGHRLVQIPATVGNRVQIYEDANAIYKAIEEAIAGAERHVHLEYYIWQPDHTGRHFRDLLVEKAREGVECRLLLDAFGCYRLTRGFLRPLLDAGCKVAFFMPLYPSRRHFNLHLRNHRKIVIVDGSTAFVGSQNIGDEYRGRLKRLSPWYDTHMRVEGGAALFLQQTFAEDWAFTTGQSLTDDRYFPVPEPVGDSTVQILPTGPHSDFSTLAQVVFAAVSAARKRIQIATPYFVPSDALQTALAHASFRGVQVQIVTCTRTDTPLVLWAGRSYYAEMLEAGVEIYEFDGGMLHSKIMAIDDRWGMLGTANMDVRSFRLNFEVTALLYDELAARKLSRSIEGHCAAARQITQRDVWRRPWLTQVLEGGARLFAPLL